MNHIYKNKKKSRIQSVAEPKFVCPTHIEVKHTETSEFGAEKVYCKDHTRRRGGSCSKTPRGFWGRVFIGKIWGKGWRV